jgi:hypothetical protein
VVAGLDLRSRLFDLPHDGMGTVRLGDGVRLVECRERVRAAVLGGGGLCGPMYGYAAPVIALIAALLLVWLALVIIGIVVKGLFWLTVVGALLFVATAIVSWARRRA